MMVRSYIGLGSNIEPREAYLRKGLKLIALEKRITILQWSSLYLSRAITRLPQPDFLNAALEIKTSLSAPGLLDILMRIERQCGRLRSGPEQPRTLDLDLLLYGQKVMQTPSLTIPHPQIEQRLFVLLPLVEIAPALTHPARRERLSMMIRRAGEQGIAQRPEGRAWAAFLKES